MHMYYCTWRVMPARTQGFDATPLQAGYLLAGVMHEPKIKQSHTRQTQKHWYTETKTRSPKNLQKEVPHKGRETEREKESTSSGGASSRTSNTKQAKLDDLGP